MRTAAFRAALVVATMTLVALLAPVGPAHAARVGSARAARGGPGTWTKIAKVEMEPRFEGRQMIMILAPR